MSLRVITLLICTAGLWVRGDLSPQEELPPVPEVDLPFPVGETLSYSIFWGWIGVGESIATTDWVRLEEDWRLRIRFRTRSNGVLARVYPVDDVVETIVDPETLRPELFTMMLKQGKRTRHEITVFDWDSLQAHYTRKREDREDDQKTYAIRPDTRDIVSLMYFLRKTPFEPRSTYAFEVMSDEKIYDLKVTTMKEENIRLDPFGKVPSLEMEPVAEFEGMVMERGKMRVWMTTRGRQVLSKILIETPFANVRLLLKGVEGPGAETWQKE